MAKLKLARRWKSVFGVFLALTFFTIAIGLSIEKRPVNLYMTARATLLGSLLLFARPSSAEHLWMCSVFYAVCNALPNFCLVLMLMHADKWRYKLLSVAGLVLVWCATGIYVHVMATSGSDEVSMSEQRPTSSSLILIDSRPHAHASHLNVGRWKLNVTQPRPTVAPKHLPRAPRARPPSLEC